MYTVQLVAQYKPGSYLTVSIYPWVVYIFPGEENYKHRWDAHFNVRQLIHDRFSPSLWESLSRKPSQNIQADLSIPAPFFCSICCFCSFPSLQKPPQSSHWKAGSKLFSILALHGILLSFQAEVYSEMPVKDIICIENVSFVNSHVLECLLHSGLHRTF